MSRTDRSAGRLHVHRAERADTLADALGDLLLDPLEDPFVSEIVSVPTRGVERWLSQSLSRRLGASPGRTDGVCAGIVFRSVDGLLGDVVATASGVDPRADPWRPDHSVWTVLQVIEASLDEPWCAALAAYLGPPGEGPDRGRRFAAARHLADLYDAYAVNRPRLLLDWQAGRRTDGLGADLPADQVWQAEIWRATRERIDRPGPAERLDTVTDRLHREPEVADLPQRVSVFGATRLSDQQTRLLAALARHRDVHLWLTHPSPALWDSVAGLAEAIRTAPSPLRRTEDPTVDCGRHALLGYLGRDLRELQTTLYRLAPAGGTALVDRHHPADAPTGRPTLLTELQRRLAEDRVGPATHVLAEADHSVQVHSAHGPDRQVDVLREVVVGALADDPTLQPRDILVMCPDIETFAPLISAGFGLAGANDDPPTGAVDAHPGHRLRVRLADRSLRQLNPLLAVLSDLIDLSGSRLTAVDVLDLIRSAPVRRKFGLDDEDLERLTDLVTRSGVRWGLDEEHRARFGMQQFGQNTWAAGLDRLLLGVAMSEDEQHFLGRALPLDDVESSDVELVGRAAECISRIGATLDRLSGTYPLTRWVEILREAIEALTDVPPRDGWQPGHAYAALADLADAAGTAPGEPVALSLADVRSLLADTLRGRPTRANFRTGSLTMCTMLPMRSVPHRMICVLGVDDGLFPRTRAVDGDDLLAAAPCVGDRDRRSEDRQTLLDAVVAATERLVLIYSGHDPRTGAPRPPAVPAGALLDELDNTATTVDGRPVRAHVVHQHPLQPFDRANFTSGGLGSPADVPFSFDRSGRRGASVAAGPRTEAASFWVGTPLPAPPPTDTVELPDLIRFFDHPVKAFLRRRAELIDGRFETEVSDDLPIALDHLQQWTIGDRMLRQRLRGVDLDRVVAAEWRRGDLPPLQLGQRTVTPIRRTVAALTDEAAPLLVGEPTNIDVTAALDGVRVTGTVGRIRGGNTVVTVHFSRLSAKHRFQAWVEILALTVSDPTVAWRSVVLTPRGSATYHAVPQDVARRYLADLVDVQRLGLVEALPLPVKTAYGYADLRRRGADLAAERDSIERTWGFERDPSWERLLGPAAPLAALLDAPARPGEDRGGMTEPTRFETLARRVWAPALWAERR